MCPYSMGTGVVIMEKCIRECRHAAPCRWLSTAKLGDPFRGNEGFTLVELIVVVALIAALVTLAIPAYDSIVTNFKVKAAIASIHVIDKEIVAYVIDKNSLPAALTDPGINTGTLNDPWGHPYVYNPVAAYRNRAGLATLNSDYDLFSVGRDGLSAQILSNSNTDDDIVRTGDGGSVELGADI